MPCVRKQAGKRTHFFPQGQSDALATRLIIMKLSAFILSKCLFQAPHGQAIHSTGIRFMPFKALLSEEALSVNQECAKRSLVCNLPTAWVEMCPRISPAPPSEARRMTSGTRHAYNVHRAGNISTRRTMSTKHYRGCVQIQEKNPQRD